MYLSIKSWKPACHTKALPLASRTGAGRPNYFPIPSSVFPLPAYKLNQNATLQNKIKYGLIGRLFFIFSIIALVLSGCKKPEEPPEFKGISNVKFREVSGNHAMVDAEALFFNPNDVKMKLKKIDVEVFLKEDKVGVINQDMKLDIPAQSDFTVPLEVAFDLKKVGSMNNLIGALFGVSFPVRFSGHVRATAHGIGFNVPVNYKDEIKLNL